MNQNVRILIPISTASLAALLAILVMPVHARDAPSVPPRPAKMNTPPEPRMPVQPIAAAEAGAGQSVPFALRVDQANTVADDPVMNSSAPSNIATSSPPVESSSGSIWNSAIEE